MLKELEHQQGFLKSVEAKLNNERFVANAKPEVVAAEQKNKRMLWRGLGFWRRVWRGCKRIF